jgi:hypothetical protein
MISKQTDCYNTPSYIKDLFQDWYDPCKISTGELRECDGLGSSWKDKTFVNPPYSKPLPWVLKAIEENKKGKRIVLLLKCDPSTKVYRLLYENNAHILLFNERIKFNGNTPNFPSMLVILEKTEGMK